jgi:hypothetical protein
LRSESAVFCVARSHGPGSSVFRRVGLCSRAARLGVVCWLAGIPAVARHGSLLRLALSVTRASLARWLARLLAALVLLGDLSMRRDRPHPIPRRSRDVGRHANQRFA